jgi:hypothetical protein
VVGELVQPRRGLLARHPLFILDLDEVHLARIRAPGRRRITHTG